MTLLINCRKKLVTLAQIHICLECMLLIEAQLECPIENLQSIFAHVYKEFLSEQSPLQHYTELCSRFYTLTIPLPNAIANDLNKMYVDLTTLQHFIIDIKFIFEENSFACEVKENCKMVYLSHTLQESFYMESLSFVSFCRIEANYYHVLQ